MLLTLTALVFGCGEKEANTPAVKLAASTITSQLDATAHAHTVTIPFTDTSASPTSDIYQYRSETNNGHSHVIALSKQQAPLSTALAATPDPNYIPSSVVSLDGASLYSANCAACHGALATSSKQNKTLSQIKAAISSNFGGMASFGTLTDAQLQAIATALVK